MKLKVEKDKKLLKQKITDVFASIERLGLSVNRIMVYNTSRNTVKKNIWINGRYGIIGKLRHYKQNLECVLLMEEY